MRLSQLFKRSSKNKPAEHAKTQNWVLSYPKSGRTWLRVMLGHVFTEHYGLSQDQIFDEKTMTQAAGLKPTDFSHDETSNSEGRDLAQLTTEKTKYVGKDVMLLVRDPRDVVVSCYFQATRRKSRYEGDIHAFIRSSTHGIRKIIQYYTIWENNRAVPASFTLLKYEELHGQPLRSLQTALAFFGAANIPQKVLEDAIDFASFDSMKEMERNNSLKNKKLRPGDVNDPESFKVRKGKIGGYREYLNEEDIAYCKTMMEEMNCPFGYQ